MCICEGLQLMGIILNKNDNSIKHSSFPYIVFKEHSGIARAPEEFLFIGPLAMMEAAIVKQ